MHIIGEKYAVKAIQKSRVRDYETFQNEIKILMNLVTTHTSIWENNIIIGSSKHYKII